MEKLIEALKRVNPTIDYENEKHLVTDKLIDSIDMSSVLAELEDTFDIEIDNDDAEQISTVGDAVEQIKNATNNN